MPDTSPLSQASPSDALAALLAAFGKSAPRAKPEKATRGQRANPRQVRKVQTVGEAFSFRKTGYTTWRAVARVIHLEEQTCDCCGSRATAVTGEFYLLDHKTSHSAWLRVEGYDIEASEDLPVRFERQEPRTVSFCGFCANEAIDNVLFQLASPQLSFPF